MFEIERAISMRVMMLVICIAMGVLGGCTQSSAPNIPTENLAKSDSTAELKTAASTVSSHSTPVVPVDDSAAAEQLKKSGFGVAVAEDNRVTAVDLRATELETVDQADEVFKELIPLNRLKSIKARGNGITNAVLARIAGLTEIVEMELVHTKLNDSGIDHLLRMARLTSLNVSQSDVADEGVEKLTVFTEMTSLDLQSTKVTNQGMVAVSKLRQLRQLSLAGTAVTDPGLSPLTGLRNLQRLDLSAAQFHDQGMEHIANMPALEVLKLRDVTVGDAGLEQIAVLVSLKSLDLAGTQITDDGLKLLSALVNLEDLDLSRTAISPATLKRIPEFRRLKRLRIEGCKQIQVEHKSELGREAPQLEIIGP